MMAAKSLTALLTGIVDYAGLFPPAALAMSEVVRNYARYLHDHNSWALGRLIIPVARLSEFEMEAEPLLPRSSSAWHLSVLAGENIRADVESISTLNSRYAGRAVIDTIEVKASNASEIKFIASIIHQTPYVFIEIPIDRDPGELIQTIGENGLQAKVRTGGVTGDAFPSCANLARFLHACVKENVRFKATAGLHHPIRSLYNLTYQADSERAKMYGYLNVFLAAAFIHNGMSVDDGKKLLAEESPDALRFDDAGVSWRSHRLDNAALKHTRENAAISFGSCSFLEPLDDLANAGLL